MKAGGRGIVSHFKNGNLTGSAVNTWKKLKIEMYSYTCPYLFFLQKYNVGFGEKKKCSVFFSFSFSLKAFKRSHLFQLSLRYWSKMHWDFIQQRNTDQNYSYNIKFVKMSNLNSTNPGLHCSFHYSYFVSTQTPVQFFTASFLQWFPFQWFKQSILKSSAQKSNYYSNTTLL